MENYNETQNRNATPYANVAPNDPSMFLDWDDVIENEGTKYIVLAEGDYEYEVTNVERGHFTGGNKIPPCNKASLTLTVQTSEGPATVKTDLLMYRTLEWKICSFFTSIGLRKHGEKLRMDWKGAIGRHGKAHFKPRSYTDKNGTERNANDLDYFIDAPEAEQPAAGNAAAQAPGSWVSQAEAQVNTAKANTFQFGPKGDNTQTNWRNNQF